MQCPFCKEYIPYCSPICFGCLNEIKYISEARDELPPCDMYGSDIIEIYPDNQKVAARETTIKLKYLNSKIQKNERKNNESIKSWKFIIWFLVLIFLIPFGIVLSVVFTEVVNSADDIIFKIVTLSSFVIISLASVMPTIVFLCREKKGIKDDKIKTEIENNNIKMHKNKFKYYYNDRIFGFSLLEKTMTNELHYRFHEIDKAKIQNISYDTYNSEYILTMFEPIFMNYNIPPTHQFRVPDVFDDTQLSIALGLDLPAKYIGF